MSFNQFTIPFFFGGTILEIFFTWPTNILIGALGSLSQILTTESFINYINNNNQVLRFIDQNHITILYHKKNHIIIMPWLVWESDT